jgi:hypothetical protein
MLYISLNPGVLNYVSASEQKGRQVVEDTGVIPFTSLNLNRTFFHEKGALTRLTELFKTVKEHVGHPQTEMHLSLPPNLIYYSFNREEKPDWVDEIRLGKDYTGSLRKKQYTLNNGYLTIWYEPLMIDLLCKAGRYEGFNIIKVTPGIINALNVIHMIYATDHYKKFAILKWDDRCPEILLFTRDHPTGHLCFYPENEMPVLRKSGNVNPDLPAVLKPDVLSEHLYDITGPLFLYSTEYTDQDSLHAFKSYGFCEIINPFTGLEVMKSEDSDFLNMSTSELSGWTESAGFINRE